MGGRRGRDVRAGSRARSLARAHRAGRHRRARCRRRSTPGRRCSRPSLTTPRSDAAAGLHRLGRGGRAAVRPAGRAGVSRRRRRWRPRPAARCRPGRPAGGTATRPRPGVSQATAGDPVNTENGDFTQSDTDLSIPTYGPALAFTRTYDAGRRSSRRQTGTPGAMGYGWTDNWASSLTPARPVPGDIYTLDGLRHRHRAGRARRRQRRWADPGGVRVQRREYLHRRHRGEPGPGDARHHRRPSGASR